MKSRQDSMQRSSSRMAFVSADSDANIVFWDRTAEVLFGYSAPELTGMPIAQVVPERLRGGLLRDLRVLRHSHIAAKKIRTIGLRKDGTEFPLSLEIAIWPRKEGPFITAILHDMTEGQERFS